MPTNSNREPLRILHVVGASEFGGVARIVVGLGRIAREEGWNADVLTTNPCFQELARQEGMGVLEMDVIRREIRPLWDLGGLLRLRAFLRQSRYQLIHTHTSKGGFVGRLAGRLAGVPAIVHTVHGFAFHEQSPAATRLLWSSLERLATRWCDRIVCVSKFHRDWAIQLGISGPGKIVAIPNGIVPAARAATVSRAELRLALGAGPLDVLVVSVSRLAPDKGLDHLLEAAAILPHSGLGIQIAIAGDGPAHDQLIRMAAARNLMGRVRFLGFRRDVGDLLHACDVVALPSVREGLSISLLEAMAAGNPIIATSIGSQREVAEHGEMAYLVPPADAVALRDAIVRVAHDPVLRTRLTANARTVYELHYTEARMLESYRRLYRELLSEKGLAAAVPGAGNGVGGGGWGIRRNRAVEGWPPMKQVCVPIRPASKNTANNECIRLATAADVSEVVAIHQQAFGSFFLTRLGADFLRRYYDLVLEYPPGIMLVAQLNGALHGFVSGFAEPSRFYRLMWRRKLQFVPPVLSAVARHPSLITRVLYGVKRVSTPRLERPDGWCELSSIAVTPGISGNGFGKSLMRGFLAQARTMDARCVYLTTDADDNDAANAFYHAAGFRRTRRFLQCEGRWMNEYVIDVAESECSSCEAAIENNSGSNA